MEVLKGWKKWEKKKVYIILKNKRVYQGIIQEIEDSGNRLIWITLSDKYKNIITFTTNEIDVMEEEEERIKWQNLHIMT